MSDKIKDSKNVVSGSNITTGSGNVHIGDNVIHQYGDKKISKVLGMPPFYPTTFFGRDADLEAIHNLLFQNNNLLLLVHGNGGMGKTTIASRYYYKYQEEYQHLAWVYSEKSMLDALLTLAVPMQIEFPPRANNAQRLDALLHELTTLNHPCLLVVDNANELSDLNTYALRLQKIPNLHLLMTTRVTEFDGATCYPVEQLPPKQALQLFKKHYPRHRAEEDELFYAIRKAVGGNTLVIELLAKNLKQLNRLKTRYTLSDLHDDLQDKGLLALQSKTVGVAYQGKGSIRQEKPEAIIAAMYELSELDAPEKQALANFAVLPAENIPYETLETLLPDFPELGDTLLALAAKGWLDYDEENASFKISPVVQEIVRAKNETLAEDTASLLNQLVEKLKYQPGVGHLENVTYEEAAVYARYGESVVLNYPTINNKLCILCERLGSYYTTVGNLNNALNYFTKYRDYEQQLCDAFPDESSFKNGLAISYSKLGETHSSLGNLDQTLQFFEKYNELREELYAAYPDTISFKNGLAISYSKLGQTHSALGNLDKALAFFEKRSQLGKELHETHPSNVGFKNGLAVSYEKLGETHSALGNLDKALAFFEKRSQLGKELHETHPSNVGFKNGLAISYSKLGQTHSALGNLDKALAFFEKDAQLTKELHETHPSNVGFKNGLAISYANLGIFYRDHRSDSSQARQYFQQAEAHWAELAEKFPGYVEFGRYLEQVKNALAELE